MLWGFAHTCLHLTVLYCSSMCLPLGFITCKSKHLPIKKGVLKHQSWITFPRLSCPCKQSYNSCLHLLRFKIAFSKNHCLTLSRLMELTFKRTESNLLDRLAFGGPVVPAIKMPPVHKLSSVPAGESVKWRLAFTVLGFGRLTVQAFILLPAKVSVLPGEDT